MPKTYNDIYIALSRRLRDAGVEANALEARLIVASAAGKSQAELLRDLQLYSSTQIEQTAADMAERRLAGEPAAYVTGRWGFYGLEFKVTPDTLIPRNDTETLVEQAVSQMGGRSDVRILDLCTGCGCVGIALVHQLPGSRAVLADLSEKALAVAQENVWTLGLADRAECVRADVKEKPTPGLGSFDLIAANPPYVPAAEVETLICGGDYEISGSNFDGNAATIGNAVYNAGKNWAVDLWDSIGEELDPDYKQNRAEEITTFVLNKTLA